MRFVTDLWTQGERVEPSRSKNPNHVPCTEVVLYSPDAVVRNLYALADSILYRYILAIIYSGGGGEKSLKHFIPVVLHNLV